MYLMDLVFIEESTPDFLENKLVNFSKLRMVSMMWFVSVILRQKDP